MIINIPGYYYAQVSPVWEVVPVLQDLTKKFGRELQDAVGPANTVDPSQRVFYNTKKMKKACAKDLISEEALHRRLDKSLSCKYKADVVNKLPPFLPMDSTAGYLRALRYAEKNILSVPLEETSERTILEHLNSLHRFVVCNDKTASLEYRKASLVIWNTLLIPPNNLNPRTFKALDTHVYKRTNPDEFNLWKTSLRAKIWKEHFVATRESQEFDDREFAVLQNVRLLDVTKISPENISKEMTDFAQALKDKLQQEKDPFVLAAWVHLTLVDIHPYSDGNGRVARIFMSIVLMQKGIKPPLIDNDMNYTQHVQKNDVPEFANYLRQLVKAQGEMPKFLSDCIRAVLLEDRLQEVPTI